MAEKEIDMKSIVVDVLKESFHAGEKDYIAVASKVERRLQEAGFAQVDPYLLGFIDQLSIGMKGFIKSINNIQENIRLFKYPLEKAEQILRIIEYQKERLSGTEGS